MPRIQTVITVNAYLKEIRKKKKEKKFALCPRNKKRENSKFSSTLFGNY